MREEKCVGGGREGREEKVYGERDRDIKEKRARQMDREKHRARERERERVSERERWFDASMGSHVRCANEDERKGPLARRARHPQVHPPARCFHSSTSLSSEQDASISPCGCHRTVFTGARIGKRAREWQCARLLVGVSGAGRDTPARAWQCARLLVGTYRRWER